jgi:hypothetical protein
VVSANDAVSKLMKTYIEYPPRKLQSESYSGPITISQYQRFKFIQDELFCRLSVEVLFVCLCLLLGGMHYAIAVVRRSIKRVELHLA